MMYLIILLIINIFFLSSFFIYSIYIYLYIAYKIDNTHTKCFFYIYIKQKKYTNIDAFNYIQTNTRTQ